MMAVFRKIKEITKNQPIDIWFFFLFLLTFTLSVRKVLFYFPIQGTFNEYSGVYLYLSDIFLILAISVWLFSILCNNNIVLSSYKLWIMSLSKQKFLFLPLILVIWSFMTVTWSQNQSIAFFRSLKLLEFYLLYLYVAFRLAPHLFHARPTMRWVEQFNIKTRECSTWNILALTLIFVATVQSIIGTAQFISQESLGLTFFKESVLSQNAPGVAKIVFDGEKYIRAYGLFPHPNVFGGFLLLSITITFLFLKLFHVEQFQGRLKLKQSLPFLSQIDRENYSKNTEDQIFDAHTQIKSFIEIVPRGTITFFSLKPLLIAFLFIMLFDHYFWDIQQGSFILWTVFGLIAGMNINFTDCSTPARKQGEWNNPVVADKIQETSAFPYFGKISNTETENVPRGTLLYAQTQNKGFNFFLKKCLWPASRAFWLILGLQILAMLLNFSKSAIAGLFVVLFFNACFIISKCSTPARQRGGWNNLKFFKTSHKMIALAFGIILVLALALSVDKKLNYQYFFIQPLKERLEYLNVSRGTIASSPVLGVGAGQTVLLSQHFSQKVIEPYEYQPVHNVFLLIWSELGIFGLVLFILFLKELFHVEQSGNINFSTPTRRLGGWNN